MTIAMTTRSYMISELAIYYNGGSDDYRLYTFFSFELVHRVLSVGMIGMKIAFPLISL